MVAPSSLLLIVVSAVATSSVACSGGGDPGNPSSGETSRGGASGAAGVGSGGASNGSGGQADAGPAATAGSGGASATDGAAGSGAKLEGGGTTDGSDGAVTSHTWTGTWASSPQGCSGGFNQRTMREIVHTSIGGTSARVRISNTFSGGPLQIRDVHLAQRTTGSSIDPATDKAVMFNGQPDVTIPAGMFALSDGAQFAVKALSDVAVSFYVVSNNGATCHQAGWQTNYSAAGNVVSSATLAGAQTNTNYLFLSNLDVLNPDAEGAVVTLGASITDGFYAPTDANRRWPNDLAVRLVMGNRVIGVLNQGISGDGVKNAVSRFDRDVLSQPNVRWVIFSDNPINDLGGGGGSAASEIDGIKTMITRAHDKGVKFLCSTLTPFVPSEPARSTVNAFIRMADNGCDGIVDQDTAAHDPAAPMRWLAAYDHGDGLHPNVAGLQAIAEAVHFDIFK
jgi:lysophospholipase L1-like esterase